MKNFGVIDSFYVLSYSLGMVVLGSLVQYIRLETYIGIGILISSLSYLFFPVVYVLTGFYNFPITIFFMSVNGFFQASCWPGIMGLFGNWFKDNKKGLLMAVWTMSGNFGNIFSTNICNVFENLNYSWFANFIITGIFGILAGLSIFIFLSEKPVEEQT